MKLKITVVSMTLLCFFSNAAYAAKGEVVYKKSGCDYFLVETSRGFTLMEWYGGNDPDEGDILVGNFESYGFKDIYNLSHESELRVYVEDYALDRDDAIEQYFEECN